MSESVDTTVDAFLGGQVMLEQPAKGYRAGLDPVLLAASVPAIAGQSVLELGSGTGAALLCLGKRVSRLILCGVELQPQYAELCRKNAAANDIQANIFTADLRNLPKDVTALTFDHVIANPPYFKRSSGKASPRSDRDLAFAGDTLMSDWIDAATRRLKPKGCLSMIQKADRLPDVLRAIDSRLGDIAVYPISGRANRVADRFILRARKGTRGQFTLHTPIPLHEGAFHVDDQPDYRVEIADVLRKGLEFKLPS